LEAEICRRSLTQFSKAAWTVLEPTTPLEWNWHLSALCEHVQAVLEDWMAVMVARQAGLPDPPQRIKNLVANVPPGSGKSRFISVFTPAWMWMRWPSWRAIFISGNPRVSLRDADYCRTLLESDWYRDLFRPEWTLARDQNAKSLYRNTEGGFRMAISAGSKVTGDRGDALFVDDPNDAAEVRSDAYRDAVNTWWDQGAGNRVNDLRCSVRVLIMQRLHECDLTGHVLKSNEWDHLIIPQEFRTDVARETKIGWRDPRTHVGELMFPTRFTPAVLKGEAARLGPTGYAGQHQQSPTPAGGARFKEGWFLTYTDEGDCYRLTRGKGDSATSWLVRDDDCQRFAVMDPAGTDPTQNAKACYTVVQAWAVTPAGDMLLLDQYREQVETPDAADAAVEFCRKWSVDYIGIEKDGMGLGVVQTVRRRGVTVQPIKARGSKEARSETAEIRMAGGMIHFPEGAPFLFELQKELLLFPMGQYADQVDCLAHAARIVQKHHGPPRNAGDAQWDAEQMAAAEREEPGHPGQSIPRDDPNAPPAPATGSDDEWLLAGN
jgi:predicted phage terminase large subunit-like protein